MRNYIILNGNNSNTISGLLIQSLPPISKPLMRTAIEEIDGRDGDIVTNLGYSAYDKEVSIGLYGTYDVDEVIKYFSDNSKGKVTFSNEPDKYYNYEIINQIDFERLIRFKTAIVTLHCQPFKYPTDETPVEITYQYVNNEAEEMDLDNTADAPMKLDLKGNTSQASDPTPDSPVDVNVVSGDNTIEICGKNLWSSEWEQGQVDSSGNNASATDRIRTKDYISVTPLQNYAIKRSIGTRFITVRCYDKNKNYLGAGDVGLNLIQGNTATNPMTNGDTTCVIQPKEDVYYLRFNDISNDLNTQYMMVKGNTPQNYEPYTGQSQLISLGNIELCKIGDYQDYIYKENDRWYLHKEIGKYVYNNNLTLNVEDTNTMQFLTPALNITPSLSENALAQISFCNVMQTKTSNYSGLSGTTSTYKIRVYIAKSIAPTQQEALDLFANKNLTIYYPLATPTDTEITDTTLISQLNNLANAKSYDPITHITQNANDKPFILNATAVQKGTDTGIVDNDGNIYSKPTLDIEGNGIVAIYLNGNQMFSVDLSNSSECIIDVTNLEAYDPETNELMNRQVTGDYSKFILPVGENQVKVSGNVTKATITDYTRWL